MSKRATRRHHRERLKKNRKSNWNVAFEENLEVLDRRASFAVNTPCPCSCPTCGNPRRHVGEIPIRELRKPNVNDDY
jgi:hypothetical protein